MKRGPVVFLQIVLLLLLICVPAAAAAADEVISLDLSKGTGDVVTASGKTAPNVWVPLKVIDAVQSIVVFDATKSDADGDYSISFKVPPGVSGKLTVVVGEGSSVAAATLTVGTTPPVDTEAPTWPVGSSIKASSITRTGLNLTWNAATDNVEVAKYKVYRDGNVIGTVDAGTKTYNVTGLSAGTGYTFRVEAGDAAGNWSIDGPSTLVKTKTAGAGGGGGGGGGITPTTPPDTEVSEFITVATGGTISCEQLTVEIPAGAIPEDATFSAAVLTEGEANAVVPEGLRVKLGSEVYEISTTGSRDFGEQMIAIKIAYDDAKIAEGEQPVLHYYDEDAQEWVALETTVVQENGKWHAVTHVNHLTKFAVFSAAVDDNVIKLTIGQSAALVNGSPYTLDAVPFIDTAADRTLVPIRFVSEALGADVEWNAGDRQVRIADASKVLILTIGSQDVLVDGTGSTIDCAPEIVSDRTFVPLRFVSETLGAQVDYSAQTKEITISR